MRLNAVLNPAAQAGRRTAAVICGLALACAGATALGSAALAQNALSGSQRNSVHSFTSTTDAGDPRGATDVSVTVLADAHEAQPDGRAVSSGDVQIEIRGAPAGMIEVNGRPQPAGFDPRALQGRIARVESRGGEGEGAPVFNIITR